MIPRSSARRVIFLSENSRLLSWAWFQMNSLEMFRVASIMVLTLIEYDYTAKSSLKKELT